MHATFHSECDPIQAAAPKTSIAWQNQMQIFPIRARTDEREMSNGRLLHFKDEGDKRNTVSPI